MTRQSPTPMASLKLTPGSLLTHLYAIHQPHTLACASILLCTRLLRIPLPKDWWILFDVEWEDIWSCAGTVMRLWRDWGLEPLSPQSQRGTGGESGSGAGQNDGAHEAHVHSDKDEWEAGRKGREARWRRAWILAQGKRAVRKWVEQNEAR